MEVESSVSIGSVRLTTVNTFIEKYSWLRARSYAGTSFFWRRKIRLLNVCITQARLMVVTNLHRSKSTDASARGQAWTSEKHSNRISHFRLVMERNDAIISLLILLEPSVRSRSLPREERARLLLGPSIQSQEERRDSSTIAVSTGVESRICRIISFSFGDERVVRTKSR